MKVIKLVFLLYLFSIVPVQATDIYINGVRADRIDLNTTGGIVTPPPPVCSTGTHLDSATQTCVPDVTPTPVGTYGERVEKAVKLNQPQGPNAWGFLDPVQGGKNPYILKPGQSVDFLADPLGVGATSIHIVNLMVGDFNQQASHGFVAMVIKLTTGNEKVGEAPINLDANQGTMIDGAFTPGQKYLINISKGTDFATGQLQIMMRIQ